MAYLSRGILPRSRVWSHNPIRYGIKYNSFTPGRGIEVEVLDSNTNEVLSSTTYIIDKSWGELIIDNINEIVDPYLEYSVPNGTTNGNSHIIYESPSSKRTCHLRYRESYPGSNTGWINDYGYRFLVIKGGINEVNFYGDVTINSSFSSNALFYPRNGLPFLTYKPFLDNRICIDEYGWILYHHADTGTPQVRYYVSYNDGTSDILTRYMTGSPANFQDRFWYIPTGPRQCLLEKANKKITGYTIVVVRVNQFNQIVSSYGTYSFIPDYGKIQKGMNLIYRNSVGGLDNIYLRGVSVIGTGSFEKRNATYPKNSLKALSGETQTFHSEGVLKFKGNTGYISREEAYRLYELFNTEEFAAIIVDGIYMPVRVPAQELKGISSEDSLHNYTVEFESAGRFRSFPRQLLNLI